MTKKDRLEDAYYFTSLTSWAPAKTERHKLLIRALELENAKVIYGSFRRRDRICPHCGRNYKFFEEKQTDVNIAIQIFRLAIEDTYDTAIIISGDSDLIPCINAIRMTYPSKKVGVVIPITRRAEELKQVCDFHFKMKEKHLASSLFPMEVDLGSNERLVCPSTWR